MVIEEVPTPIYPTFFVGIMDTSKKVLVVAPKGRSHYFLPGDSIEDVRKYWGLTSNCGRFLIFASSASNGSVD